MAGSDPAGGRACENTHAPTPSLGRPWAGSLPSPPHRPVWPRPAGQLRRKTQWRRLHMRWAACESGPSRFCESTPRVVFTS